MGGFDLPRDEKGHYMCSVVHTGCYRIQEGTQI